MAGNQSTAVYLLVATITMAAMAGISSAATYTVGDTTGWTIPTSASFYPNWASKQSFHVGDVLVFNFPATAHTVAEVSKTAYDSCTTSNPLSAVMTTSPSNITISSTGTHYFLCTVVGHCPNGQKLSIVATAASSSPAPTPKKSPSPAPAPAPTTATPSSSPAAAPTKASPSSSPATTPTASAPAPATSFPPVGGPATGPTPPSGGPPAGGPTAGSTPSSGGPTAGSNPASAAGGPSSDGGSSPLPSDNFAATDAGGVSLLSLVSLVAAALLF